MTSTKTTAIVLLSGGLDSMVSAARALEDGFAVHALTVNYGQRHRIELDRAKTIAKKLNLSSQTEISLDLRAFGGSARHCVARSIIGQRLIQASCDSPQATKRLRPS